MFCFVTKTHIRDKFQLSTFNYQDLQSALSSELRAVEEKRAMFFAPQEFTKLPKAQPALGYGASGSIER